VLTPLDEGRFTPGSLLAGRYRIVGLLGRGGMGEVYRADDLKLRQTVALKLLPSGLTGDPSRLSRFVNEVRVARRVSHPNVCRVRRSARPTWAPDRQNVLEGAHRIRKAYDTLLPRRCRGALTASGGEKSKV
jgi:serine/threonine protein kinase